MNVFLKRGGKKMNKKIIGIFIVSLLITAGIVTGKYNYQENVKKRVN